MQTKIQTLEKPETIIKLGNNTYYYNYDITPCKIYVNELDKVEIKDGWSYLPVYILGQPNYKDCVKNIIRAYLSLEEEFDLINSYNSDNLNLLDNTNAKKEYIDYLKLLSNIKKEVKKVFK